MIITLTGDNQYRINAELIKLKETLGIADDLALTNISGREITIEAIKLELSSYSLFSVKRLIVLHEPSKAKGFSEDIEQIAEMLPEDTTVVILEPTLDKRKSYYKYLQKNTDFRQLNKLSGPDLTKWITEYVRERKGTISFGDAKYLIDRTYDDQLMLSQEITKLLIYSPDINRQTIDLLTEQSASSTIFELLDAAFNLNSKKALDIYGDQRLQRVEPEQILAMLSWQLNTLAIYMASKSLSASEVQSISGLSPYTLAKARQISTKLSFTSLRRLVSELTNLDFRSKTATFDLDEGLKNFIVSLNQ